MGEMSDFELGMIAYDAYCAATGGVSLISGDKLPTFPNLKGEIQNAWVAAAKAVQTEVEFFD
jgi:hypothetical protein